VGAATVAAAAAATKKSESGPTQIVISHIVASELQETEKGLFAKQDPYIVVKWHGQQARSSIKKDAGKKCSWDGEELRLVVSGGVADLSESLIVEVWNDNLGDKKASEDVLVGSGSIDVSGLKAGKGGAVGEKKTIALQYIDKKGREKTGGKLEVTLSLLEEGGPGAGEASSGTSATTTARDVMGKAIVAAHEASNDDNNDNDNRVLKDIRLAISKLAIDLKRDTEKGLFAKQDPYIMFQWLGKKAHSSIIRDAGKKCTWPPDEEVVVELQESDDAFLYEMEIEVWNDNQGDKKVTDDVLIGRGILSLEGMPNSTSALDRIVKLTYEDGRDSEKSAGELYLSVQCSIKDCLKVAEAVDQVQPRRAPKEVRPLLTAEELSGNLVLCDLEAEDMPETESL
jgi:hypothetical protein